MNILDKVILSGGTGAIGIALIQKFITEKIYVTVVCHKGSKRIQNIPLSKYVDIVECDLCEISNLVGILPHDYKIFYHFAWAGTVGESRNDMYAQVSNIQHTLDSVEVAAKLGCRRFIGAGSQAEYGRYDGKLSAYTPVFPENGYGMAKLCAGQMSRVRCEQLGLEHIWTRILSVYGPYDWENSFMMLLIRGLLNGEKVSCTKGEQIWDYLYSKDAAEAFYLLGKNGVDKKVYCIGSGKSSSLLSYIDCVRESIDQTAEIGVGEIPYTDKQVMHLCADISDLKKDTGFRPVYSFGDGIKETITWVKEKG